MLCEQQFNNLPAINVRGVVPDLRLCDLRHFAETTRARFEYGIRHRTRPLKAGKSRPLGMSSFDGKTFSSPNARPPTPRTVMRHHPIHTFEGSLHRAGKIPGHNITHSLQMPHYSDPARSHYVNRRTILAVGRAPLSSWLRLGEIPNRLIIYAFCLGQSGFISQNY